MHADEHALVGEDKVDVAALRSIGRLAGSVYVHVTDLFEIEQKNLQTSSK
jgi:hypothetical protein